MIRNRSQQKYFKFLPIESGLKMDNIHIMTVGMVLDYIQEFIDHNNPKKEKKKRKATQTDFDAF